MRLRFKLKRPPPRLPKPEFFGPVTHRRNAVSVVQIVPPHRVDLNLPKSPAEEIAVPASINGRSLINGKL
ncbi:hypothetical protein LPJGGPFB_05148 [Ensifer adhaerens]|nr:hypothetical protein [Ensifer adhaerens]